MNLRLATIADIPRLRELIRDSVSTLSDHCYSPAQIASGLSHVFGVDTQLILDLILSVGAGLVPARAYLRSSGNRGQGQALPLQFYKLPVAGAGANAKLYSAVTKLSRIKQDQMRLKLYSIP